MRGNMQSRLNLIVSLGCSIVGLSFVLFDSTELQAQEPAQELPRRSATYETNRADEPLADEFSFDQAVRFMNKTSSWWQDRKDCVTCHTNGLSLVGQAMLPTPHPATELSREFAQSYLKSFIVDGRVPRGQHGSIEGLVTTSAMLAISDAIVNQGQLKPATRQALDYVWSKQDASGAWTGWLKCDWPPFEHDDHFGVSLMAVAVAMAGEEYAQSPTAKVGIQRINRYLKKHPPTNSHQKGMLLWAGRYMPNLVPAKKKHQWREELLALQQEDGGWSLLSLGDESWKRAGNGNRQDTISDAYGTGFAIFVLRQAGIKADSPALKGGVDWLKSNQRESGRWFTRSLKFRTTPSKHYISHAGTTFAIMALIECGQK
jgi:squalene-hopene/tetraprenyl-beta-curcumene cyclase